MFKAPVKSKFALCKVFLLSQKSKMSIYDVFRPVFRASMVFGMTPFDVKGATFKNNKCLAVWSIVLAIVCTVLGARDLVKREFTNSHLLISDTTDFLLAWTNLLNDAAIMLCNCVFKKKVRV